MKKILCFLLTIMTSSIHACGFEFQQMLLQNRQATLGAAPIGMFHEKVTSWANEFSVPNFPVDQNDGQSNEWGRRDEKDDRERLAVESKYLSSKQVKLLQQARNAKTFEEAKSILANQSGSFVDYTLAVRNPEKYEWGDYPVLNRYHHVPKPDLSITDEPWRLWGLYMLGKTQFRQGHYQASIKSLSQVQALVAAGLDDPLHVAADSLGFQSMAYNELGQYDRATENYLKLKKLNHPSATLWLKHHARNLIFSLRDLYWLEESEEQLNDHKDKLLKAIEQTLTRRLLITYAYTHMGGDHFDLLSSLVKHHQSLEPNAQIEEADQLAAFAYRLGHYDSAEQLVKLNNSDLTQLITAKLLLRKGQVNDAKLIYSQLVSNLKNLTINNLNSESCAVIADSAILALSEGEIETAFDLLVNHTGGEYWQDVVYIAEHLLPIDVLIEKTQKISETHSVKYSQSDLYNDGYIVKENKQGEIRAGIEINYPKALQYLTARRLAREGQLDRAIQMMPYENHKRNLTEFKKLSDRMKSPDKSAALGFEMAEWMLEHGPRIYAYEGAPDWLMFQLQYTPDFNYLGGKSTDSDLKHPIEGELISQNKDKLTNKRFSYRWRATELARKAASLLPPSNPNYEHYLCHATKWIINHDSSLADEIFKEFIKNAKPKKDRKYFGSRCKPVIKDKVG